MFKIIAYSFQPFHIFANRSKRAAFYYREQHRRQAPGDKHDRVGSERLTVRVVRPGASWPQACLGECEIIFENQVLSIASLGASADLHQMGPGNLSHKSAETNGSNFRNPPMMIPCLRTASTPRYSPLLL